jgi:hypothetical protein
MKSSDPQFDAKAHFATGVGAVLHRRRDRGERFFPGWVFDEDDEFVQTALAGLRSAGLNPEITQYSFCTNGSHYAGEAGIKTIGFGPSRETSPTPSTNTSRSINCCKPPRATTESCRRCFRKVNQHENSDRERLGRRRLGQPRFAA